MTVWNSHGRVSAALPSGASSSASSPCEAARAAAVARSLDRPVVSGLVEDAYAAAVPPAAAAPGSATTVTCAGCQRSAVGSRGVLARSWQAQARAP